MFLNLFDNALLLHLPLESPKGAFNAFTIENSNFCQCLTPASSLRQLARYMLPVAEERSTMSGVVIENGLREGLMPRRFSLFSSFDSINSSLVAMYPRKIPSFFMNRVPLSALCDLTDSPWSSSSCRTLTIVGDSMVMGYCDGVSNLPMSLIDQFRALFLRSGWFE